VETIERASQQRPSAAITSQIKPQIPSQLPNV